MNALAEYRAVQRSVADDAVARHADLVRRIAHHLAARLPASVEVDDLIQAGMIGLIEASRSYDPDQGASFETYASIRIRGSMIDEIRRGDWVPRSVRARAREIEKVHAKLEHRLHRTHHERERDEQQRHDDRRLGGVEDDADRTRRSVQRQQHQARHDGR